LLENFPGAFGQSLQPSIKQLPNIIECNQLLLDKAVTVSKPE